MSAIERTPQGSAFVDLCAAAEGDAELRAWCEQVQYDEMLLLLESSRQGHQQLAGG